MHKSFYITTPIYYVNDAPHIGHAYTTLACDVIARFMKLDGYDVKFLTGTDEHGQKVEQSAKKIGIDPQTFTDQVSQKFRDLANDLNCCHNDFIRTTEERHKKAAQALWKRLEEKGQIYLGHYAGWYAVRDEAFYAESELVNGKAPTGADVEWVEEPSYFFKLSEWQEPLLKFYEAHPDFIAPVGRKNEVISFVKGGLKDLSISRTTFKWGVPVPGNPDHIMYVWLDALTNYMTAVGFPDENSEDYKKYWPADIHVVGKDILRFHAVYWPAFLLAAGLMPPKRIYAHGWWTNEGEKISKSLRNTIDPYDLIKEYGLDPTRYYMVREVPFGNDGNFSHDSMVNRINSELANDLGNLAQRSLSMIFKNCGGILPEPGNLQQDDLDLLNAAKAILPQLRVYMAKDQALHKYCEAVWSIVGAANKYVDTQAPWGLKKTDPKRMETVLYTLAETIRIVSLYVQPLMPESSAKLLDQLKVSEKDRTFSALDTPLSGNTPIDKPQPIFPRYVKEEKEC